MNQTLYYPSVEMEGRVNLINLLIDGIKNGQITPYDATTEDNEFKIPITIAQVNEYFGATTTMTEKIDFNTGERTMVPVTSNPRLDEVKQYLIKNVFTMITGFDLE